MKEWRKQRDLLCEKYATDEALSKAKALLSLHDQSEEGFLGAQAVLILKGLL